MEVLSLAAFLCLSGVVNSLGASGFRAYGDYGKDVTDIMDILMRPRTPERYFPESHFEKFGNDFSTRLKGFSFKDCGTPGRESGKVFDLQLTPDPLRLPGQIGLAFKAQNMKAAQAPIQAAVILKKKIGFWIEVPCMHNIGSCTYSDICKMLPQQQCPQVFITHKIPCKCPVPQGNFTLPQTQFTADVSSAPSGDYYAKVELKSESGPLACFEMNFSIA